MLERKGGFLSGLARKLTSRGSDKPARRQCPHGNNADWRSHSSKSSAAGPPGEDPPAYTAVFAKGSTLPAESMTPDADSDFGFLAIFDTIFLIDDSGSMKGRKWQETAEVLQAIAPICTQYDADGIDIYFLNSRQERKNVSLPSAVVELFKTVQPTTLTPTGQSLRRILLPYLKEFEKSPDDTKPINIIIITDGRPTDDVESPIVEAARKLDKLEACAWQVGIQFVQIGDDTGAREHLKRLDDELRKISGHDELRDMVDTVPFTGKAGDKLNADGILKVVLGSVIRRKDNESEHMMHGHTSA